MHPDFDKLVDSAGLRRVASQLRDAALPAVGFSLVPQTDGLPVGASKLGGRPDLPANFDWPTNKRRPLDYLLQINLADTQPFDSSNQLPDSGLLTFFYDLNDQSWGYDPADLDGFRVVYTAEVTTLSAQDIPDDEYSLAECSLEFRTTYTLPHVETRAAQRLGKSAEFNEDEEDAYYDLPWSLEELYSESEDAGNHRLLGHSANIQSDMQLEAQLVTNGLYCGDATGYNDPRAKTLEPGAEDWILLLQLDSDDDADIMWGDCGMLYYWIRKEDLAAGKFENVWMTMQCS